MLAISLTIDQVWCQTNRTFLYQLQLVFDQGVLMVGNWAGKAVDFCLDKSQQGEPCQNKVFGLFLVN